MVDIIKKAIFLPKEENRNAEKTGRVSRELFYISDNLERGEKVFKAGEWCSNHFYIFIINIIYE